MGITKGETRGVNSNNTRIKKNYTPIENQVQIFGVPQN